MTITILCAGALAAPAPAETPAPPGRPPHAGPSDSGPLARLLARTQPPRALRPANDPVAVPRELPDEAWLRERFRVAGPGAIAAQALHALPGRPAAGDGPALLLRPVHLQAGLDHVVMNLPPQDLITPEEAGALVDAANRLFAPDGLRWSADTPQAWCLRSTTPAGRERLAALAELRCRSARLAAGRNIDRWQPEGTAAAAWRAITSELQMLWFTHPVNERREARGQPVLNSVWLEGAPGQAGLRAFDAVITTDDAIAGLALAAGADANTLPAAATPEDFARLAAIQEQAATMLLTPGWWRQAAAHGDPAAWHTAWDHLDTLLERLAGAELPVSRVVLGGEHDLLDFDIRPASRWAFWRRQRLAALLADRR